MINENVGTAKVDTNAKVIADMDKAQANFMEARAENRNAEEMKMADKIITKNRGG